MYIKPIRQDIVISRTIKGRIYIKSKYMNEDFNKPLKTKNNEYL